MGCIERMYSLQEHCSKGEKSELLHSTVVSTAPNRHISSIRSGMVLIQLNTFKIERTNVGDFQCFLQKRMQYETH